PAFAQNINDLLTIFNGDRQRALRHAALAEWRHLPPAEVACIDRGLHQKGSSADALVRKGVKPSAAGLAELRSGCHRQFVQGVQTDTAQRVTGASQAGLPTADVPASTPTARNNAGETTPPSAATLSPSAETVGRVADERVRQAPVESKVRLQ